MPVPLPAAAHLLDLPRCTLVEVPFRVVNPERAIDLLGGGDKVAAAIANPRQVPLELRLRQDPYHHPLTGHHFTRDKILMRVLVSQVPPEAREAWDRGDVARVLPLLDHPAVVPVAVASSQFQFREMADFQYLTRDNPLVQQTRSLVLAGGLDALEQITPVLYDTGNDSLDNYANKELHLPPPPRFSSVNTPHQYQYMRNPAVLVVSEDGQVKLVQRNLRIKLHTLMVGVDEPAPSAPHPELVARLAKYAQLEAAAGDALFTPPASLHLTADTLRCIEALRDLFARKPVWIRRHLHLVLPPALRTQCKVALPYVLYVMKRGPWRQTYIKLGVDPRLGPEFWQYQQELFRLLGYFHQRSGREGENGDANPEGDDWLGLRLVATPTYPYPEIPEELVFTGTRLPATLMFQLGDLADPLLLEQVMPHRRQAPRDSPEFATNGWVDVDTMEKIRRVIRYKLRRMLYREPVEALELAKILELLYKGEPASAGQEGEEDEGEEEDEEDEEETVEAGPDVDEDLREVHVLDAALEAVLARLAEANPEGAAVLKTVLGYVRQEVDEAVPRA